MRSLLLTAFLATALVPLAGCNLYFSGGDDDDPCEEWGGGPAPGLEAPSLLRNPETGQCEDWSWNDPWRPCDGQCGPCVGGGPLPDGTGPGSTDPTPPPEPGDEPTDSEDREAPGAAQVPPPTWGHCESYCTGLGEQGCLATDGCRGIYDQGDDGPGQFQECWQTDYSDWGVINCEGLDAYSCSTSDACIAVHTNACDGLDADSFQACTPGFFLSCHNEERPAPDVCTGDQDCDQGFACNASEICLPPPGSGNGDEPVPSVCYGYCTPVDCLPIDVDCPDGYAKICPPGGCEADCTCEPIDPGECDGDVFCESLPPECEAGTTPGILNGCWSGQCIPLDQCPSAECADIQGESMCIAREDCAAYYVGENCGCDASGCTCQEWSFDSCGQD